MHIALYNRNFEAQHSDTFSLVLKTLKEYQIVPVLYEGMLPHFEKYNLLPQEYKVFSSPADLDGKIKCMLSMGGDGTILDTVTYVAEKGIPLLGINLGRLGFLAATGKDYISTAIKNIVNETFVIEERELIHLDTNKNIFQEAPYALNELTLHRKDSSSMMIIHTYINGEFLCSYWADGLIVSTPTGSTGYSLSCGGPVIFPLAKNFVITPVAPHNLNVRPVVVPDNNIISFEIEGRADQYMCTLDARSESIDATTSLAVRKENFKLKLIRLEGQNFLQTLRHKLYWGLDRRN